MSCGPHRDRFRDVVRAVPGGCAVSSDELRERYRQQMLQQIGGWSGMLLAAVPTVVFVVVNAFAGLWPAILAALGVAALLAGYRLVRRQPVQQAITGVGGVVVAAVVAAWTGQARGYFLWGIWSSFAYGAVFLVSVLGRRPLVGLLWEFLDPTKGLPEGTPWWKVPVLQRGYDLATLAATAIFAARAVVQLALFRKDATGWLAFAKIAMGYPLTVAAIGLAFLVVRRARVRVTVRG